MKFSQYIKEDLEQFTDNSRNAILDLFMNNDNIDDKMVHDLSDKLKINTHEFEEQIYLLLSTFTHGGRAKDKGITEKDVDPKELQMGIKVEMEHLNKKSPYAPIIAKKIALDHLSEMSDYYSKLKVMEGDGK